MAAPGEEDEEWAAAAAEPAAKRRAVSGDADENENVFVALLREATMQAIDFRGLLDNAVSLLAEALAKDTTVLEIRIQGSLISNKTARKIAVALEENSTLQVLYLCQNAITYKGAQAIAWAIAKNKTLHVLDLARCGMPPDGVRSFAAVLAINTALRELVLPAFHDAVLQRDQIMQELARSIAETWAPLSKIAMEDCELFYQSLHVLLPMRRVQLERWRRHERVTAYFWLCVRLSERGLNGYGLHGIVRSIVDFAETAYKADLVASHQAKIANELAARPGNSGWVSYFYGF